MYTYLVSWHAIDLIIRLTNFMEKGSMEGGLDIYAHKGSCFKIINYKLNVKNYKGFKFTVYSKNMNNFTQFNNSR